MCPPTAFGCGWPNASDFLAFEAFPWFRQATLQQIFAVELFHRDHLYWPELDVDLDLERIHHPDKFPLVSRIDSHKIS